MEIQDLPRPSLLICLCLDLPFYAWGYRGAVFPRMVYRTPTLCMGLAWKTLFSRQKLHGSPVPHNYCIQIPVGLTWHKSPFMMRHMRWWPCTTGRKVAYKRYRCNAPPPRASIGTPLLTFTLVIPQVDTFFALSNQTRIAASRKGQQRSQTRVWILVSRRYQSI
jgi:hypothetical protein